jgi:hypothetical protein
MHSVKLYIFLKHVWLGVLNVQGFMNRILYRSGQQSVNKWLIRSMSTYGAVQLMEHIKNIPLVMPVPMNLSVAMPLTGSRIENEFLEGIRMLMHWRSTEIGELIIQQPTLPCLPRYESHHLLLKNNAIENNPTTINRAHSGKRLVVN